MKPRRTTLAFCAIVLLTAPLAALLAAPAAAAAPAPPPPPTGWALPEELTVAPGLPTLPHRTSLVADAGGHVTAAWISQVNSNFYVVAARAAPGEPVGRTQVLSDGYDLYGEVVVAASDDGSAMVVWDGVRSDTGSDYVISYALYTPDRGWSASQPVSDAANRSGWALGPDLAAGPDGTYVCAWLETDPSAYRVHAAVFGTGGWQQSSNLSAGPGLWFPRVAADSLGDAVVSWVENVSAHDMPRASYYSPSGGWEAAATLTTDVASSHAQPEVALDGSGRAFALWRATPSTGAHRIDAALHPHGGSWLLPATVGRTLSGGEYHLVPLAAGGPMTAVFVGDNSSYYGVTGATWTGTSGWSAPTFIHDLPGEDTWGLTASAGPDGGAIVGFEHMENNDTLTRVATTVHFVPGAGWGAEDSPAPPGDWARFFPGVAAGPGGSAAALYITRDATGDRVFLARYQAPDTAPPGLALTAPADGAHTDTGSVLVQGTTEPGARVEVGGTAAAVAPDGSFQARVALDPGANTVTVTATDAAGNRATAFVDVTFDDPVPALQAALEEAQANASAAAEGLAAAQGDLAAAVDDLNATQSDLSDAQAELAAASQDRASLRDALAASTDEVRLLQAQQNQTASTLIDTTDSNAALSGQVATLSLVAFIALVAAVAGIGLTLVQARRGGGPPPAEGGRPPAP